MVTVVVILNVLIALLCFYVARWLTKLRKKLAKAADTLISAEKSTNKVLTSSPKTIYKGQKGAKALGERYQALNRQLEQLEKVLGLLNLAPKLWRQQATWRRSGVAKKQR